MNAFFIAATGQNVGKTTLSLGLMSGLQKRFSSVGFLKPVGQQQVTAEQGVCVDKDVLLFKSHFKLSTDLEKMSPVLLPRGYTRDYLDGKIDHKYLIKSIQHSFLSIQQENPITIVEGTGHTGVGSIINLNNAQVAALLKTPIVLIAPGGLGSSFDELCLNVTQCEKHNVRVAGVILNKVLNHKREMVVEYMQKALKQLHLPLLGAVPYHPFLSTPTMFDFEQLFEQPLLSGEMHRLRHFDHIRLVSSPIEMYRDASFSSQLLITPASREDMILATISRFWNEKLSHPEEELQTGLILTGKLGLKESLIEELKKAEIPTLYTPVNQFTALKMIQAYTTKIRQNDTLKIEEAIRIVEKHLNFDQLLKIS